MTFLNIFTSDDATPKHSAGGETQCTKMALGIFPVVVLIIFIILMSLSLKNSTEIYSSGKIRFIYRFIDHRERLLMQDDDHLVMISWMKKWLAGTLVLTGSDLDLRRQTKWKQTKWKRTVKSGLYLFVLLILMSGDVQIQPGPFDQATKITAIEFPHGICEKNVKSNQAALQCDSCDIWTHCKCLNMLHSEYYHLGKSDDDWIYDPCSLSGFSESFFEDDVPELDVASLSDGHPLEFECFKTKGLTFIHLYTHSLLPKIDELSILAENTKVAVTGITEMLLDATINDAEVEI